VIEHRITTLDRGSVVAQADRLDRELHGRGGRLSDEQRQAIMLACSDHQLVMIEGQAGTGKSTALTGIARAHHDAGREVILTSTAAVAAERLARELHHAGVDTRHYSLAALQTAITNGTVLLGPQTTIIHDEAALASTREQHALLAAVETSGARLIAVGDPHQNPPVGAGGLWPHLETATRDQHSQAVLTRNLRAHDPGDRRDQARFRDGHHELAVRGYAARARVHTGADLTRAEDAALDAAHTDAQHGRTTIVLAQTSNDHLDELNARYQAIRHQHSELGTDTIPAPGRPYSLHPGDEVQVRRTINHPDHGPLRNGTTALIRDIADQVQQYGSIAKIPAAKAGNTRNDMYLASEAIRVLQKDKASDLTKEDIATLAAYKKNLDSATKFIPDWVKISVAIALGLGTMIGWKRIVVTVGEKIGKTHLTYAQGASAELVAMSTIFAADIYGLPVSTTHVLSSGVAGTMAANGSGLQMATVRNLLMAWVLTLPMAMLISGSLFYLFTRIF